MTGLLHLARLLVDVRIVIGSYEVPLAVTVWVGVGCLAVSAALLWLEVQRDRARHRA